MKLERLHEYVTSTVVIGGGMLIAVLCATWTGSGQMKLVGAIGGLALFIASILTFRTRVWLLLPLCWDLPGRIPILNMPLAVRDMAVLFVFGSFLIFSAVKILRTKVTYTSLDLLLFANIVYLGTVYYRNPVGVSWLGSELVGGRPYFNIAIACCAFLVLQRVPVDIQTTRWLPFTLLLSSALVSLGSLFIRIFPSSAGFLGSLYSTFAPQDADSGVETMEENVGRLSGLSMFGSTGIRALTSYFAPTTLLSPLYPFRLIGTLGSIVMIMLSGFRSALFTAGLLLLMSAYFRRRFQDLIILSVIGLTLYAILAFGNGAVFNLPLSAQRALSFLPGNWDQNAVLDAQGSSQWRFQMWKAVLQEDQWIRNKWLGDGFGFSKRDLEIMFSEMRGGAGFIGGMEGQGSMIVGAYHSGPLSTVRYVGIVGLVLFLPFLIGLAVRAFRLIRQAERTPLFAVSLFVGMPLIIGPFIFTLMVGGFDNGLPEAIYALGLLNVLERTLIKYKSEAPVTPKMEGIQTVAPPRPAPLRRRPLPVQ